MLRPLSSPAAVGYLTVWCENGAFTLLDSQLVANQSFQNLAISSGTYLLHNYDPGTRSWQDRGFCEQVTIQDAETLTVDLRQKNKLRIFSNPAGGLVYSDSFFIGRTPLVMVEPDLARKHFTILKPGYQNYSFNQEADKNEYFLQLRPAGQPSALAGLQTPDNQHRLKWLDEGLIITSLSASWLSFLFKRKADTYYEKYLRSARPAEISKYYDRTLRFDRYAEISFTVSLLALGGYFYILLKE
jgi:hypothetical protein